MSTLYSHNTRSSFVMFYSNLYIDLQLKIKSSYGNTSEYSYMTFVSALIITYDVINVKELRGILTSKHIRRSFYSVSNSSIKRVYCKDRNMDSLRAIYGGVC